MSQPPYRRLDDLVFLKAFAEGLFSFGSGKEAKSPFEDPTIVRPSTLTNYYERLGLDNFVNDTVEIRGAYRRQAMTWHPDRNPNYQHEAETEFKAVDEAFQTLSDPPKKKQYDELLRQQLGTGGKEHTWQRSPGNAVKAARYSRSYIKVTEIDDRLSAEQRATLDYLDFLVDSGQISCGDAGEIVMQNYGSQCSYCADVIPTSFASLTYRSSEMQLGDAYCHAFLAHGARAFIVESMKKLPQDWDRLAHSLKYISSIIKNLGIQIPDKAKCESKLKLLLN